MATVAENTGGQGPDDGKGTNSQDGTQSTGEQGKADDSGSDDPGATGDIDFAAKYEAERAKAVALQGQLNAAAEKADKAERATLSETENMKRDLDKLQKIAEEYDTFKKTTYLKLQVIEESGSKYKWNEKAIDDVVSSVDLDKITFSDLKDGKLKIDGLDMELKRIAKEKDYLLAPTGDSGNDGGSGGGNPGPGGGQPSGAHPYGSSGGSSKTDSDLLKKYKIA